MSMGYDEMRAVSGTIGLIFFVLIFVGVVVWAYRPGARRAFEEAGKIPLKED